VENKALIIGLTVIAVAGAATTTAALYTEGLTMQGTHWIMLLVAVAAGYVAGRLFAQPAQMLGLP
jgi:hypothetical protein